MACLPVQRSLRCLNMKTESRISWTMSFHSLQTSMQDDSVFAPRTLARIMSTSSMGILWRSMMRCVRTMLARLKMKNCYIYGRAVGNAFATQMPWRLARQIRGPKQIMIDKTRLRHSKSMILTPRGLFGSAILCIIIVPLSTGGGIRAYTSRLGAWICTKQPAIMTKHT